MYLLNAALCRAGQAGQEDEDDEERGGVQREEENTAEEKKGENASLGVHLEQGIGRPLKAHSHLDSLEL